jgi:hypothetical protein
MSEDGDALLARLQELVPGLMARGQAAEAAARIPDETIGALHAADAFRAVVPKSHGGLEVDFPIIPQIFRTLGVCHRHPARRLGIVFGAGDRRTGPER